MKMSLYRDLRSTCSSRVAGQRFYSCSSRGKAKTKGKVLPHMGQKGAVSGSGPAARTASLSLPSAPTQSCGEVYLVVRVGAFSPYCVSPTRLSAPSGACPVLKASVVSLPQVIPMPVIVRARLMRAPAQPR